MILTLMPTVKGSKLTAHFLDFEYLIDTGTVEVLLRNVWEHFEQDIIKYSSQTQNFLLVVAAFLIIGDGLIEG